MIARHGEMHMASGPEGLMENTAPMLPYEDLSQLEKEALEEAIRMAWARLPEAAMPLGIDLMMTDEESTTRLLRDEIDKLRTDIAQLVPGFSEETFQHIPESENVSDSSGLLAKAHQKKPDLVFRPVHLPRALRGKVPSSRYGLFVECKIIHRSTDHRGISDYCGNDGLLRFIDGRYASGMPSGMMIAYVRTHDDVSTSLAPHLLDPKCRADYEVIADPALCKVRRPAAPPIYVSKHGRSKVTVGGIATGSIEIAHLWLRVPGAPSVAPNPSRRTLTAR